ncbi:unnamed protein product [Urochloa decumbens]|uniref:Calmodulin-binding domain-containing protein n=1 Tax=Urochloa decumbens TaxID=240449 RepID=A0ABC8VIH5_9POAL
MTEEVIKEVITSIPASAEPKCEDLLINSPVIIDGTSPVIIDGTSVPPDIKRKEKPVPHYLRASSKSCHDNCKFGIKHSSEPKKYWPISRKQLRRASTGNHEQGRIEIILPKTARPIKENQKLKNSHEKDGDATAPDCEDEVSSDGAESIELEMPLAIQDIDESDEHTEDAIMPSNNVSEVGEPSVMDHMPDQSGNECANSDKRTTQAVIASKKYEQAALGTKPKSSAKEPEIQKVKATLSVTRNTVSSQRNGRASHPKATGVAIDSSNVPKTTKKPADATADKKLSKPLRKFSPTVASAAPKVKEIKVLSPSDAMDLSAKPARLAKRKASSAKKAPSPSLSSGKQIDRDMKEKNVAKNAQVLKKKGDEKVISGPLKLSRSVNMSGKSISSVRLRSIRKDKIAPPMRNSKKVAETENSDTGAKIAKEKSLKMASPKVRKPEVSNKESRPPRKEKLDTPRTANARRPKPASIASSSTTAPGPQPRKLTFRRGKVLNPDVGSSSTPRRLRFRPATAATDASATRSRGSRIAGRRSGSSSSVREASAEVVVLRRLQDGKETKKQEQVLLNNVIEETASRLVAEARKSKVKALVGAFETVISLQETGKAAAPVVASVAR